MKLSHRQVRIAVVVLAVSMVIFAVGGYLWQSAPLRGANQDTLQKSGHVLGVMGFELRYDGLRTGELPFFEPGYAIWANYPYFTLGDETYERAGVGGVIIRRHYVRPTRYLVTETIDGLNKFSGHPNKSTLTIIDKKTHKVIASQILQGWGWVGQQAAEFVRSVLVPDEPIGVGGVGAKRYPRVPVEIEPIDVVLYPRTARAVDRRSSCRAIREAQAPSIDHYGDFVPKDRSRTLPAPMAMYWSCPGFFRILFTSTY